MNEQLSPENAISIQHNDWLKHPVTRQMLTILDKQKQNIVQSMATSSGLSIDPSWFKEQAGNIKTIDTIKIWVSNTEQFINQLNKK